MFNSVITSTPLTTTVADNVFKNVIGTNFQIDASFTATLRALIAPRMGDNDTLRLSVAVTSANHTAMDRQTVTNYVYYALDGFYPEDPGRLFVHVFTRDGKENVAFMREHFKEVFPEWTELEKVHDLFVKTFQCCCFINPEKKSTILMVDGMDYSKWHYIQCAILGMLPWYFDKDKGCTELEMKLIYSLRQKTAREYLECMREYSEMYNFRELNIRNSLKGIEHANDQRMIEEKRSLVESIHQRIESLNERVLSAYRELDDANAILSGYLLRDTEADDDNPIMDYFLCNKNIELVRVRGTEIVFNVRGYLEYYDEEMVERMIENPRSFVYHERSYGDSVSGTDMAKVLKAIFLDHTLRMKVCAQYNIDLVGGVSGISNATFDGQYDDCMPNPHIQRYSCMGNYSRVINELIADGDYISAIDQCGVSLKSLNWADSCVMSVFMQTMYGHQYNNCCIELPDGSTVTPAKAVEYLKLLDNEEE